MVLKFFKKHLKVFILIASVLVSFPIFIFRDKLAGLQNYGFLGLFILSILGNATIIFPAPIIFTAFVGGAIFNPFLVAIAVALGASIGELTGYMAGYGAGNILEKDARVNKVKKWIDKFGLWALFVLAIIPNPLFDLAGIVAGATGVPVYKYLIVVFTGKLIKFSAFAYLGSSSAVLLEKFL